MLCACAGNAFIGVDFDEIPVASCFDVFCVVIDLGLIACELFVVVGGDPGVSGNAALPALANGRGGEGHRIGLN